MASLAPTPILTSPSAGLDQASRLRALFEALGAGAPALRPAPAPTPTPARHLPIVSIASGKGGVGKTSIAVNLAITLARRGLRVTLLDGDLGVANADVMLGINPPRRLEHVLAQARGGSAGSGGGARRIALEDIAVTAPGGFRLIPGSVGVARMADLSATERRWLAEALCELASSADVLLVDTGAGVGPIVRTLVAASDLTLVVTSPEPTAIADAYALIKCVRQGHAEHRGSMGLVVNESRSTEEAAAVHARIQAVTRRFLALEIPLLGSIAQDVRMSAAVRMRKPVALTDPNCEAAREIGRIAQRVVGLMGLEAAPIRESNAPRRFRVWLGALLKA